MYPVVIGGLGGSGTRLIAQILMDVGVFMGDDLNSANDNLSFTFFFKRPEQFKAGKLPVDSYLSLFEKHMLGKSYGLKEKITLIKAYGKRENYPASFYRRRLSKMLLSKNSRRKNPPEKWGWKEPNSHIFLGYIADHFPAMSYIHVMRSGVDMAFSGNLQQLNNWGDLYAIKPPTDKKQEAQLQLEYWVRANKAVIEKGKRLLGDRFFLCNYDELCVNPVSNIQSLLSFLKIPVDPSKLHQLAKLPSIPSSMGRYKEHDLSMFAPEHLDSVREMGFTV